VLISPLIYENLPYDPVNDLVPIGKIGDIGLILVTSTSGKIRTLADVMSAASAQAGGLSYGTAGVGTAPHIFIESYKQRTGTNLVHIPYKGGASAITDVVGNQIPLVATTVPSAIPQIKAGKLVGLAVSTQARSKSLPDVPTFMESGIPDLFYNTWFALFAPTGTPKPILDKLNTELNALTSDPEFRDKLSDMGILATVSASDTFAAEIRRDLERYRPIIRKAGIKAE
jgi:tripartite-type tricarboxylate transporter receptor subunit TctC